MPPSMRGQRRWHCWGLMLLAETVASARETDSGTAAAGLVARAAGGGGQPCRSGRSGAGRACQLAGPSSRAHRHGRRVGADDRRGAAERRCLCRLRRRPRARLGGAGRAARTRRSGARRAKPGVADLAAKLGHDEERGAALALAAAQDWSRRCCRANCARSPCCMGWLAGPWASLLAGRGAVLVALRLGLLGGLADRKPSLPPLGIRLPELVSGSIAQPVRCFDNIRQPRGLRQINDRGKTNGMDPETSSG